VGWRARVLQNLQFDINCTPCEILVERSFHASKAGPCKSFPTLDWVTCRSSSRFSLRAATNLFFLFASQFPAGQELSAPSNCDSKCIQGGVHPVRLSMGTVNVSNRAPAAIGHAKGSNPPGSFPPWLRANLDEFFAGPRASRADCSITTYFRTENLQVAE